MSKVTILLAPDHILVASSLRLYSKADIRAALPTYIANPIPFETELVGEDAAEEAFDLTNNPCRQTEREQKYGRGRSVSSGDVVDVDGVKYVCLSVGWAVLED